MYSRWVRRRRGEQKQIAGKGFRHGGPHRLGFEGLESRELLAVVVTTPLNGSEGFPISGQIATFASTDVQGSSPQATIAWGDGHTTTGTVVANGSNFNVNGANTYAVLGTYPITVTVTGTDSSSASGTGQATVAAVPFLATATTITPTAGQPFTDVVASFSDPYPSVNAASYRATIAWGDGHTSIGTITPDGSAFDVTGTNTYAAPGSDTITVTVIRIIDNQMAAATSSAVVVAPSLTASGTTIVATAGQPFTGTTAVFTDAVPQPVPTGYSASIAWGDGQTSVGTVMANAQGSFDVVGTHVYGAPSSSQSVTVTIVRVANGQTVMATSAAVVVNAPSALSGQLDPQSDTGVSGTDGITSINQPAFTGTALPYAIVQLFGRRSDQAQPVFLGQAVANANGAWSLSVGALPDGVYAFSASQIPPTGLPSPMVALTPGSVTIDTVPPTVLGVTFVPGTRLIDVVLKDALSGLDLASVANPANYALLGPHGTRIHPSSVTIVPNATVRPGDPITAALQFSTAVRPHAGQIVALAGISDLAGNRLRREYVRSSPGNGQPSAAQASGHLAARLHRQERRR